MGIKRQHIYWVDLDPTQGREIKKRRPCLVISPDIYNDNSGLVTVVPLTDIYNGIVRKTEIAVYKADVCIDKDSKIKPDQIRTLSVDRFVTPDLGKLSDEKFAKVRQLISEHLNL